MQKQAINALRILSVEAIERANSGHPGIALGAAPMFYTLWARHLRHNPKSPNFFDRDRFVLSAGHGSSLLYSGLHLFGYDLSKEDLMVFRQLRSRTPGHPEHGVTAGVEVSTGPLGQGFANAVGFALAEKMLAGRFNHDDAVLIDHYTYCMCGDGDIQEGITSEAASLAGTWNLGKLIVLYDSNDITIEGSTETNFTENVALKFKSMGWHVLRVENGDDTDEISAAITLAKKQTTKPTLIEVKTTIGFGSDKAGTADCHGAPLGADSVKGLKKTLGWTAKPFEVPNDIVKHYAELQPELAKHEAEAKKRANNYKNKYPAEFESFNNAIKGKFVDLTEIEEFWSYDNSKAMATRSACEVALNRLVELQPNLVGGSADLGPSNKTILKSKDYFSPTTPHGSNIQFGIREHAMAAISNGLSLHGGFLPYVATFLAFSDYLKPAARMSALMELNNLFIFSHDSIGVGEDGPTHQPVEHVLSFRSIPDFKVFRPADGVEVSAALAVALSEKGPSAIITSRQNLPIVEGTSKDALNGGYIVSDSTKETPDVILMASGSELSLALAAKKELANADIDARVVSMLSMEVFESKAAKYRQSVLPPNVRARIAIEAGSSLSWHRYVGLDGACITMDKFGQSAPAETLFMIYGFSVDNVVAVAKKTFKACSKLAIGATETESDNLTSN